MEELQNIRKQLFAYRNGVIADRLRAAGSPYSLIFGLNLPQLKIVADGVEKNADLARAMWADEHCRELHLLAPMVMPVEELSKVEAIDVCRAVRTHEEADVLCLRLLRYHPEAETIATELLRATEMLHYIALRLAVNLQALGNLANEASFINEAQAVLSDADSSVQLRSVASLLVEED